MEYKKEWNVSDFTDIKPTENSHKEIMKMVNTRRPYSPSDYVKRHFIENIANNPAQAAMYRAHNEFFTKGY